MEVSAVWLAANVTGYEWLKTVSELPSWKVSAILTLSKDSQTVMYDHLGHIGKDQNAWKEFGLPVYETARIDNEAGLLKKLKPDYLIVAGWRQILPKKILDIPKNGTLGFHPALLPKYRGPNPIITQIIEGETNSGTTLFYVEEGLDDGDIIGQEHCAIAKDDYAWDVYQKEISAGRKLIRTYFPLLAKCKAPMITQNESKATFNRKRSLAENEIDFSKPTEEVYRQIRALSKPYLGAHVSSGDKKLKIWRARPIKVKNTVPGRYSIQEDLPVIETADGGLLLEQIALNDSFINPADFTKLTSGKNCQDIKNIVCDIRWNK